jgi:hypothetical protein
MSESAATVAASDMRLPRMCRWFGHSFRKVSTKGDMLSHDRVKRYTWVTVEKCWRCNTERRIEHFDRHGYWFAFHREVEDRRLEEVIRRATR